MIKRKKSDDAPTDLLRRICKEEDHDDGDRALLLPLRKHQRDALQAARDARRLLLRAPPGWGKTRVAIKRAVDVMANNHDGRVLVAVTLGTLYTVWEKELQDANLHAFLRVLRGSELSSVQSLPPPPCIVLCTYDTLAASFREGWSQQTSVVQEVRPGKLQRRAVRGRRPEGHFLIDGPYELVILDEVHEVRVPATIKARAAAAAAARASCALGMSATPVNRHVKELAGVLQALGAKVPSDLNAPGSLNAMLDMVFSGNHSEVLQEFPSLAPEKTVWYDLQELAPPAAQLYNAQLNRGRMLARSLEDVCRAAEKKRPFAAQRNMFFSTACSSPGNVPREKKSSKQTLMAQVRAALHRLELAAVHALLAQRSLQGKSVSSEDLKTIATEGSAHLRAVSRVLQELHVQGHDLIVVCAPRVQLQRAIEAHVRHVVGCQTFQYHGSMSIDERGRVLQAFQREKSGSDDAAQQKKKKTLFLSQLAGGVGLSLVQASAIVFPSLWFTHPPYAASACVRALTTTGSFFLNARQE